MAGRRPRSRVRGSKAFRRLLKQIPDAVAKQMLGVLDQGGRSLRTIMRARAPLGKTGRLRAAIDYRVYPKSLRLRVGQLSRSKKAPFYLRIQDLGRKAQTVTVDRRKVGVNSGLRHGRKKSEEVASRYLLRVRAMKPKRFISGGFPDLRATIGTGLRGIWDRSLRTIAGGARD